MTVLNQFIATAIVNLLALAHGCGLGWTSPAIPYLTSNDTHLVDGPITASEVSWIGSCISIGAFVSTIFSGLIANFIGKKNTLVILTIPNLIFWVVIYSAQEVNVIIVARFIAGLTGGGIFRILGLYITDIAENSLRGGLGSLFPLTMYTGMLLTFILGNELDYFTLSIIMMVIPILGCVLTFFLPETPHFLIEKKEFDRAKKSLKFYRTCNSKSSQDDLKKVDEEFEFIKNGVSNALSTKLEFKDFTTKNAKIGISIGFFLTFLLTFSGNSVIMMYTAFIFKTTGSSLDANVSAIIIATMQILGIILMGLIVDRAGRKVLMIISCGGSSLTLILLAIYCTYKESGTDLMHLEWAPIVLLSICIVSQSIGISSLPFVMIGELVPFKIRETCALLCMLFVAVFMFITLKVFPETVKVAGMSVCFWFFGVVCFIGFFIAIFFMPETKGKDLFKEEQAVNS